MPRGPQTAFLIAAAGTRPQTRRPLALTLLERHLRRALQKVLAEIFQDLPRRQKQAVALIGLDRQGHHGRLVGSRYLHPGRDCKPKLFIRPLDCLSDGPPRAAGLCELNGVEHRVNVRGRPAWRGSTY